MAARRPSDTWFALDPDPPGLFGRASPLWDVLILLLLVGAVLLVLTPLLSEASWLYF